MNMTGNTILITGGASGIGLALAKRFSARGNSVIIAGRRAEALADAKRSVPALHTLVADVSTEAGRIALAETALAQFPALNMLVNNAGVQKRPAPLTQTQDWSAHKAEIATNLEAPMHLSMLMIPHFLKAPSAAIINITSGLAFVPIAFMPTYCLTKAAIHSFSQTLRHQLRETQIGVIEIAPPAVNTDLGGPGLHTFGADVDAFADHCFVMMDKGAVEFGYESSETRRVAGFQEREQAFAQMNTARI